MSSCRSARKPGWSTFAPCADKFKGLPIKLSKMLLLGSVWEKEVGAMAAHWELHGANVKGQMVLVRTKSAAARQELSLRAPALIRSLNKYFDKPWIKQIKAVSPQA